MYPNKQIALSGLNLHIQPKEFVTIVGASGAGKSTLIKLLTREEVQTSGKIIVGGLDYDTITYNNIPLLRRRIGVVFQDFKLLPNRNVYENVAFALEVAGASNREIKRSVPRMLQLVGLANKEKSFPRELSGGERQRVAIARALVRQPKILVADEPTGNLDSKTADDVLDIFTAFADEGKTIVLVTHERDLSERVDRVVGLKDGRILTDIPGGRGAKSKGAFDA